MQIALAADLLTAQGVGFFQDTPHADAENRQIENAGVQRLREV
jgi:hypothetical protein